MKIAVINGSPKGDLSITMQYVKYIQKNFRDYQINIFNISKEIHNIETDKSRFAQIINEIGQSDGVLWATPVYYYLVPSQLKRFIELIFENKVGEIFQDKYAAVLTTSIHFFDTIACNYLNGICDDLGMNYVGEFLAEMNDLQIR